MDTNLKFNPASAAFFIYIGGFITLNILGGTGALSQNFVENTMTILAIAAIILAVSSDWWVSSIIHLFSSIAAAEHARNV